MGKEETTSGLELFLRVSRRSGAPLRGQVQEGIRTAIRHGVLAPGSQLPSTRSLAQDLGLSRGLVVEAYDQLVAEGYLSSRRGSGTRVASGAASAGIAVPPVSGPPRHRFDLRPGVPDLSTFPRSAWLAAVRQVLADIPSAALGYGDPQGPLSVRTELAAYLGRVRGVLADPSQVVVCSGLSQGLALLFGVLRRRGVLEIGVEDPGWPRGREFVSRGRLRPVPVSVDDEGLSVEELEATGAPVMMATPAHQFPRGVVLSPSRRAGLLEWARRSQGIVIEDDYDAEFRYDREPIGSLQGLAPERVVYAGSVSKTLAPALRLAWLIVPSDLREEVIEAKYADDRGSPALDQLTLAAFVSSGALDRHRRRCRVHYRDTRDRLVEALSREAPAVRVEGIAAGLHLLARMPPGTDEASIIAHGADRGVGLYGLSDYLMTPRQGPPALVVGYGAVPKPDLHEAFEILATTLAVHSQPGHPGWS